MRMQYQGTDAIQLGLMAVVHGGTWPWRSQWSGLRAFGQKPEPEWVCLLFFFFFSSFPCWSPMVLGYCPLPERGSLLLLWSSFLLSSFRRMSGIFTVLSAYLILFFWQLLFLDVSSGQLYPVLPTLMITLLIQLCKIVFGYAIVMLENTWILLLVWLF